MGLSGSSASVHLQYPSIKRREPVILPGGGLLRFIAMDETRHDFESIAYNIWQHNQYLHVGYLWFGSEILEKRFDDFELARWDEWIERGSC